jgi:3-isopropylmalate/(R)-2-methylmalate dehydratase small subunit
MQPFTTLKGVAAPLNMINVDTDMIIPKNYLKTIKRTGLGKHLFAEMRYDEQGREKPDFVLNKGPYRGASILVSGQNFGCGSSREHAPWALTGYGLRAVISTSFADIFRNNSLKNGLLPVIVDPETHRSLFELAEEAPNAEISIDLESQSVTLPGGETISFPIDPFSKACLLKGVDQLGYIMSFEEDIAAFENRGVENRE